jgi:transcriptional regulator with XRE-family HTH domain
MTTGKHNIDRDELGRTLFEAREAAGVRQADAATAAGVSQNKISRIEHKQGHLLTQPEAAALLSLYKVRGEERRRIMAMIEASRTQHVDARVILQKGAHNFQERFRVLAKESRQVRSFVPMAAIGYLQTPAYMRIVFTQRMAEEQTEPSIRNRVDQQRVVVEDPDRQWVMIQTEGALRWNIGGPEVMAEQVDRIADAIDRPNVKLGFIPWHKPVDFLPMTGFHIYDQRAVVVGTWSGTAIIRNSEEVEVYEDLFQRVVSLAVFGDEARTELRRIADDYRRLENA